MNKAETFEWLAAQIVSTREIPQSRYAHYGNVTAYLRSGRYHYCQIDNAKYAAVGIARVDVPEALHGQGHFKAFIVELEDEARRLGYQFLRVEQPCQFVIDMLEKHGYTQHDAVRSDVWAKRL